MRTLNIAVALLAAFTAGRAQVTTAPVSRPVPNLLSRIAVGRAFTHENLTLFPLTGPVSAGRSYSLLEDAIRTGQVKVQEKDGGQVNTVRMKNTGKTYVFGISGEIVSGARQDRMLQDDVLLPPVSGWLDVPVYCTEHGRWAGTSSFGTKGQMVAGNVRERAAKTRSQGEVWAAVDEARSALKVETPTQAFAKVYEDKDVQEQARPYIEKLDGLPDIVPNAVGVAVAVGGRLVCVDVFGSPALFQKMWPKLLNSYVIDAMTAEPRGSTSARRVQQLIRSAASARLSEWPTVGAGTLYRVAGAGVSGSALEFGRGVVHLDLFPDDNSEPVDEGAPSLQHRRQRVVD
jgi:hypothetical protein